MGREPRLRRDPERRRLPRRRVDLEVDARPGGSHAAPEVHGLTTATAVWLSAGVGIMCGGALYVPAFFACAVAIVYLRFAPRSGGAHHENLSPSHSADPIIAGSVDALPRRGLSIHS